jgi:hypothetical protein
MMENGKRLYLHEEILLLVLRDEEGTVASGPMFEYAIGGGILAELLLNERLTVESKGRKKNKQVVHLKSSTPMSNDVIDECLSKVKAAGKPKSPQHWVMKFAQTKDLKERVAARLCDLGILSSDRKQVLWIFERKIFPEVDHTAEAEIVARLEDAVFTDSPDVSTRTILLTSLADGAGLLSLVFDKNDLKGRKARIKMMVESEVVGRATAETVQAVQAALAVGSLATLGVATSGTTFAH